MLKSGRATGLGRSPGRVAPDGGPAPGGRRPSRRHGRWRCNNPDVLLIAEHSAWCGRGPGLGREVAHLALHRTGIVPPPALLGRDRKSTRLNSSHANISYAVFCLKKKNTKTLAMASSVYGDMTS